MHVPPGKHPRGTQTVRGTMEGILVPGVGISLLLPFITHAALLSSRWLRVAHNTTLHYTQRRGLHVKGNI